MSELPEFRQYIDVATTVELLKQLYRQGREDGSVVLYFHGLPTNAEELNSLAREICIALPFPKRKTAGSILAIDSAVHQTIEIYTGPRYTRHMQLHED